MIAEFIDETGNSTFKILKIKRTFIRGGRVMPGVSGFVARGDGITTCVMCGKQLTDELSFARTIGPECIKKYGSMPEKEYVEKYAKEFKRYQNKQIKKGNDVLSFGKWLYEIKGERS